MRIFLSILLTCVVSVSFSQRTSYFRRVFVDAEYYLLYEDYKEALPLYIEIFNSFPDNANVNYRIGLCYLNIPNEKQKAMPFFEKAKQSITNEYKEGYFTETNAPLEVYLHYGIALRVASQFDKAMEAFQEYLGLLPNDDSNKEQRLMVHKEMQSIEYAQELMEKPINVRFTSVGKHINARFAEINPVVSADESTMIYTSIQQFYNALLTSEKRAGVWNNPMGINSHLFADGPIATVGLSSDGNTLLLARNDNDVYNLYISTFDSAKGSWSAMSRLPKEINTRHWENYACFSPTGDTIYYSSNQPGGMGGFDIYMSVKTDNGWTAGENLSLNINTPYDEIAPYISPDGKRLFFSSNGHPTMGGFDTFVSELKDGKWSKPRNLGYPFNTTDDDIFFCPIGDGSKGYVSRLMPQSFGNNDIYLVEFEEAP